MPRPPETSVKPRDVSASQETRSIARLDKRRPNNLQAHRTARVADIAAMHFQAIHSPSSNQSAITARPDRIALRISKPFGAATPGRPSGWIVIVRLLGDQRLRRQNQAGHRG